MKKIIVCRIIAVVLIVFLLVGCQSVPVSESGVSDVNSVSNTQGRTLRIFSLYEDYSLRITVETFKAMNEDIEVEYEYLFEETATQTAINDAVHRINTEIMNGTGPDVLYTIGLPVRTYLQKGVLLDLSEIIDTSDFYPTFAQPLTEGGTFLVPLGAQLPVVIGKDGNADNTQAQLEAIRQGASIPLQTLQGLWEWDVYSGEVPIPLEERAGMVFMSINTIFDDLWASVSDKVIVDNVLQKDTLRQILQTMQEYYNIVQFDPQNYERGRGYGGGPDVNGVSLSFWTNGSTWPMLWGMADYGLDRIGNIDSLAVLFAPELFPENTPLTELSVVASRGIGVAAWEPVCTMAVPASSAETELAQEFIQYCLSPEMQGRSLLDGGFLLAVTRQGMQRQMATITDALQGTAREIDVEAFKVWVEELISGYERPQQILGGAVDIKELAFEAAIALYEGKTTIDAAINDIEAQVQTYLRELV